MSIAAEAPIPSSSRTIAGYYTLAGLYTLSAAAIWGVNTLFLLDAGLSFFEVFVANAAFSLGTVLFEIPTGVVADTLGRRMSFLLSVSVLGVSTLAYVGLAEIDAGVLAFSLASMVMALGFTFYSGAMEAWLVDALAATGYQGILDRVFARGSQVTSAAMLVGTIGGGFLGQVDLSIPYILRSVLLVAVFAVAFVVMHDVGFTPRPVPASQLPTEIAKNARAGVAFGWGQRPLRLLMLAAALQLGFLSWAFYASQPYLLDLLESDAVWVVGVVAAAIALSTMAGNQVVSIAARRCGRRTTLLLDRRGRADGGSGRPRHRRLVLGRASRAAPRHGGPRGDEPRSPGVPPSARPLRAARDRRLLRLDGLGRRRRRRAGRAGRARRGALGRLGIRRGRARDGRSDSALCRSASNRGTGRRHRGLARRCGIELSARPAGSRDGRCRSLWRSSSRNAELAAHV